MLCIHLFQLYLFTSMNEIICEKVDSFETCEIYTRNSFQNKSVFSPTTAKLQHCTPVNRNNKKQCDICAKSFTESGSLAQHELIHSGIKNYQCDVCTKSFTRSSNLAQHKLIHSGIKKYQCDVCSKSFIQSSTLARHKLCNPSLFLFYFLFKRVH